MLPGRDSLGVEAERVDKTPATGFEGPIGRGPSVREGAQAPGVTVFKFRAKVRERDRQSCSAWMLLRTLIFATARTWSFTIPFTTCPFVN